jgi:hypothetical protein
MKNSPGGDRTHDLGVTYIRIFKNYIMFMI